MGPGRPGRNGASSLSTETPGVLPGVSGFPGKLGGREPRRRGQAGGLLPLSGALGVHSAEAKAPWSVWGVARRESDSFSHAPHRPRCPLFPEDPHWGDPRPLPSTPVPGPCHLL